VKLVETTDYPFEDTIRIQIKTSKPVSFPLYLRIPGWATAAAIAVNGQAVSAAVKPLSYVSLRRTWKDGDSVVLTLPMDVSLRTWKKNKSSVSVDYGPLTFSLKIGETWKVSGGTNKWPNQAVYPETAWNYGLVLDSNNPKSSFEVVKKSAPLPLQPFAHDGAPLEIRAKARKIPEWKLNDVGLVGSLNPSPVLSNEPEETILLIPMGAARLRITSFPVIGSGPDATPWATETKCQ
jgi:hypothetical protein